MVLHNSLDSRRLSQLPQRLRATAEKAAKGSAALDDLSRVVRAVRTIPRDQARLLLPVFYVHLDPSRIPQPDALEAAIYAKLYLPSISAAVASMNGLNDLGDLLCVPDEAARDLWPRVWPWIDFLHTNWSCIPGLDDSSKTNAILIHSQILLMLADDVETSAIVAATSDVRALIARAWVTILDDNSIISPPALMQGLGRHLNFLINGIGKQSNFREVVEGAGGALDHLASALVKHLDTAIATPKSPVPVASIRAVMVFLQGRTDINDRLHWLVLSSRIGASLVSALLYLHEPGTPSTDDTAQMCFMYLSIYLSQYAPNYIRIAEALEAGILRCIMLFAAYGEASPIHSMLQNLLGFVLPSGLVSYAVLLQMKKAFPDAKDLSQSAPFVNSALFPQWRTFATLAEARMKVLDDWEATGRLSRRACDNLECDQICDRHQRLPPRERGFMRALLNAEYRRVQYPLSLETIQFIARNPGKPFLIAFDFSAYTTPGGMTLDILTKDDRVVRKLKADLPTQWERLERAHGRMEVHFVAIADGADDVQLLLPMRANSSKFHDGLRRIASTVRPGEDAYQSGMRVGHDLNTLITVADREVIQTH
ncbi:hypothetical protein B0H17DRAFT_1337566 [Mycena rosella]|uniref:Uncharacterized protein n=1 Tax=Mycena rosella TaxID=1033263 RepID=A0AAD7CRF9_MYCRO|nr:hypothetical protein B0H17DRAFT_1337566 [Mycena rosella]